MGRKKTYTLWDRNPSPFCKCYYCEHLISMHGACTCKAFPTDDNNIPDVIIYNKIVHTQIIDNQIGDYVYSHKSKQS